MCEQTNYLTNVAFAAEAIPDTPGGVVFQIEIPCDQLNSLLHAREDCSEARVPCQVAMDVTAAECIAVSLLNAITAARQAREPKLHPGIARYLGTASPFLTAGDDWLPTEGQDSRD